MSKVIEFQVDVSRVGVIGTRTETFQAKSFDRLVKNFPKHLKKKWVKIKWEENGIDKEMTRSDYELLNSQ